MPVQLDSLAADRRMSTLAGAQHGLVTRAQLIAAGLTRNQVEVRLERRTLHPVHRGVYAVGHSVLTPKGNLLAAAWSGGPLAVLSRAAAGGVWGIRRSSSTRIDVTVPSQAG